MRARFSLETSLQKVVFFSLAMVVYALSMHARLGIELADDGAFFLRYAQNMLEGEFWVWNLGEAPVWGASAPLYPLVLALVMKLGVAPLPALVGSSMAMSVVALSIVATLLARRFGVIAGAMFVFLSALDSGAMYYSGAGLETPLTSLLLALGMWALLGQWRGWALGLVAGLLMVNKLDLVPVGGLLLLAAWLRDRRFPMQAVMVAAAIALAWYLFAWAYFGAPVPNSFLTKSLHQDNLPKIIDWTWFGKRILGGTHAWSVALALLGGVLLGKRILPLIVYLGGLLAVHLLAYTVKHPFEPYDWYAMPSVFALLALASIGAQAITDQLASKLGGQALIVRGAVPLALASLIFATSIGRERAETANVQRFVAYQEFDRAEAGRWVAENTPKDFRVLTAWGNPAYHSQREVVDASFLNRKFGELPTGADRPEILVWQNNPGSTPTALVFSNHIDAGYKPVKIFDNTFAAGMDYFFAVLVRDDMVDRVRNIDPPRDLMNYVSGAALGDTYGQLKGISAGALFVHPGASTPTRFEFDLAEFAKSTGQATAMLEAKVAPNVPPDALERGAANMRVSFNADAAMIEQGVVTAGAPLLLKVNVSLHPKLTVLVDNNGSADTDWLIISAK